MTNSTTSEHSGKLVWSLTRNEPYRIHTEHAKCVGATYPVKRLSADDNHCVISDCGADLAHKNELGCTYKKKHILREQITDHIWSLTVTSSAAQCRTFSDGPGETDFKLIYCTIRFILCRWSGRASMPDCY